MTKETTSINELKELILVYTGKTDRLITKTDNLYELILSTKHELTEQIEGVVRNTKNEFKQMKEYIVDTKIELTALIYKVNNETKTELKELILETKRETFDYVDYKIDSKLDEFAVMVNHGFAQQGAQINLLSEDMSTIKDDVSFIKQDVAEIRDRLDVMEYKKKNDQGRPFNLDELDY